MSIKILMLSHKFYPAIGGIETVSEFLANSFSKAGHSVRLVTWTKNEYSENYPFQVIRKPGVLKLLQHYMWADVIFENNPCLKLSWPNLIFERPSIIGLHTWIARADGTQGFRDKLKLLWLKRACKVVACSAAVRDKCWPQALVIGNTYDDETFRVVNDTPRTFDFVYLGRLVSDKGIEVAIRAFHKLCLAESASVKSLATYSMTIIGDGPEKSQLQELVSKLRLEKHINFTGTLRGEALVKCLNLHHCLVVPSIWEEPFGIVALEGMACGCVPIVSDGGGLPNAVGNAGITFKRGSVNSLMEKMQQIVNSTDLKQQLRAAAKVQLAAHHSSEISRQYLSVINEAISSTTKP